MLSKTYKYFLYLDNYAYWTIVLTVFKQFFGKKRHNTEIVNIEIKNSKSTIMWQNNIYILREANKFPLKEWSSLFLNAKSCLTYRSIVSYKKRIKICLFVNYLFVNCAFLLRNSKRYINNSIFTKNYLMNTWYTIFFIETILKTNTIPHRHTLSTFSMAIEWPSSKMLWNKTKMPWNKPKNYVVISANRAVKKALICNRHIHETGTN